MDVIKAIHYNGSSVGLMGVYIGMHREFSDWEKIVVKIGCLDEFRFQENYIYMASDHSGERDYIRVRIIGKEVIDGFSVNLHTNDSASRDLAWSYIQELQKTVKNDKNNITVFSTIESNPCNYKFGLTLDIMQ